VLYTITFKSGAQQEVKLGTEDVVKLVAGLEAVNKQPDHRGLLHTADAAILLNDVVGFAPFVSMAERYGSGPIPSSE
jgi:hypothetical protein